MKPTKQTTTYTSNENGTNSYVYFDFDKNQWRVQFSWQTSRPNAHFYKRDVPLNYQILNFYPLEDSYDWFYDYKTNSLRLHSCKYYDVPNEIKRLLYNNYIPLDHYLRRQKSFIGVRNMRILGHLNNFCHFIFTLNPNKISRNILMIDMIRLNGIIDYIHRKNDGKLFLGNYQPNTNPYSINSYGQDQIMKLVGMGYKSLNFMRKIEHVKLINDL